VKYPGLRLLGSVVEGFAVRQAHGSNNGLGTRPKAGISNFRAKNFPTLRRKPGRTAGPLTTNFWGKTRQIDRSIRLCGQVLEALASDGGARENACEVALSRPP
jgi:hypothetical protein